ncbi:MAG TPA: ABC transporter ATP-binding protein, partial [Pirellulales bacterium]
GLSLPWRTEATAYVPAAWDKVRRLAGRHRQRGRENIITQGLRREGMLLRTDDLTKDYHGFRALDRLTLSVAPGEVFGLLGPNGSGKSTALRLLLGFLRPTSGKASIHGHDCWHDSVAVRRHVGYLPGELRLYENMTGRQLIRFLSDLRQVADEAEVDRLARAFDIDLSRPIAQLSSGMKRKVALLQVLAPRTPLLILDEPTNTLDPTMREELLVQLRRARDRGQAVLFSSHVLGEVEQIRDRVGILQRGRLVHLQAMTELRQARLIRARFARPPERLPELPDLRCQAGQGEEVTLEYGGPLPPLLDWLGRQQVTDLTVAPLGLAAIYNRYHGAET